MENKEMQAAPKKGVIRRIIRTLFSFYPVLMPVVLFCILFNAIVGSIPAVFMQKVIAVVEQNWQSGDWNGCKVEILRYTGILLTLYGLALAASIFYNRKMAELMNESVKNVTAPSGRVVQFVAKRGEVGVHMALADRGYDMQQLKNGIWASGRVAYKKKNVDMV